jgi:predicted Zn finger-like uncharacterized protein
MLVQCPNCKTTYKVSEDVMKGSTPAFRCSRCRHTFELEAEEPPQVPAEQASNGSVDSEAAVQDRELSFSFPPKETVAPAVGAQTPKAATEPPLDEFPSKANAAEDQWSFNGENANGAGAVNDDVPFTIPELSSAAESQQTFDAPEELAAEHSAIATEEDAAGSLPNILPMSSYMDQQASVLPYLTLFTLLMIGFSLAAVITYAHPKASEELVRNIPLLGTAVLKNSHLKDGILLQSLRGGFQTIQGNREVFVITGVALNQNPVVVREIQLTGTVHNDSGKELEQQTIWVGNTLSAKILRGMTPEDIPHLQSLKPLKSFEMPPGDSMPFAMVFLKASKGVKDFNCAVTFADSES